MTRRFGRFLRRNTIALLALFIALSGTTFAAAVALPKNSVGTAQLKNGAVTKKKINKKTIRQLKGNRGPAGPQGPQGPTGPQGVQGVQGPAGPFPAALPATKSLYGTFNVECDGSVCEGGNAHFTYPLASAPTVHYIQAGQAPPAGCSGSVSAPAAAPGNFCAFEGNSGGSPTGRGIVNPANDGTGSATRFGAGFYLQGSAGSNHWMEGVWVVTGTPGSAAAAKSISSGTRVN
jgi:hypothetical protein